MNRICSFYLKKICNDVKVFIVTFDKFYGSLMYNSVDFLKNLTDLKVLNGDVYDDCCAHRRCMKS